MQQSIYVYSSMYVHTYSFLPFPFFDMYFELFNTKDAASRAVEEEEFIIVLQQQEEEQQQQSRERERESPSVSQ